MVTRRRFVLGGIAGGIAVVAGANRDAFARQPKPGPRKKPRGRVVGQVYAEPMTPLGAPPGGALATRGGAVFSVANANDAYVAVVELGSVPKAGPVLVLSRREIAAESWGTGFGASGSSRGSASWRVDRARADEIAKLWRVVRRDRAMLGAGLVARWKPKPGSAFVVGKPMPIVVTLDNSGSAPVWFNVGGRQRGSRDNRFAFGASRDGGAAMPVLDAPDFGGIGAVQPLEPGKTLERSEDLAKWVVIDRPGVYRVTCRYELELTTGTDGGRWPAKGHEVWDWATDDVIDVKVG